jgi:hypothetical protein
VPALSYSRVRTAAATDAVGRPVLRVFCGLMLLALPGLSLAAVTVESPPLADAGAEFTVTVTGSTNARDFVTVVAPGTREGAYQAYRYVTAPKVTLVAPAKAGAYELRVLGAEAPYPTLARRPLQVRAVEATLDAPAQVEAGAPLEVQWSGPANARDYVAIGTATRPYVSYVYTRDGSPARLRAPEAAGEYELRYILGNGDAVIARRPITVGAVAASLVAPAQVAAGAKFRVEWQGPGRAKEFVTIVKAGTPEQRFTAYEYVGAGRALELRAPDEPGDYELRYLTAQDYRTLARARVVVTPVSGTVQGPSEAVAGSAVLVRWTGPNNPRDYVTIVPKGARERTSADYAYTSSGNPVRIDAPLEPGEYEIRYALAQSQTTLARTPLRVTPGAVRPGAVQVLAPATARPTDRTVHVILDASGSMLQRLGAERRIDVARRTLTKLVTTTLPAGTPFALRAFGRAADSCDTDLVVPLGPLDPAKIAQTTRSLEAKNGARTPLGASLDAVGADLRAARGERLVILLTDGEETCNGDPAAAIERLQKSSPAAVVNIVGFAVDEPALAATFRQWATLGGGAYFDARDAAALDRAMAESVQPRFELVDARERVVARGRVGGEPVAVMPGDYRVRVRGASAPPRRVEVSAGTTASVQL